MLEFKSNKKFIMCTPIFSETFANRLNFKEFSQFEISPFQIKRHKSGALMLMHVEAVVNLAVFLQEFE